MAAPVTAALLVIGDEILSGRTKDKNIGYIAEYLTGIGVDLSEVRVVPDVEAEIVAAVNALRSRYTYVFTTGGIGPTHDDITADAIAKAFGVTIDIDPRAVAMMQERYQPGELNEARLANGAHPRGRRPDRERHLQGAGISPRQCVRDGRRAGDHAIHAGRHRPEPRDRPPDDCRDPSMPKVCPKASMRMAWARSPARIPLVSIGSYPSFSTAGFHNQIVVRGKDAEAVANAVAAVHDLLRRLKGDGAPL